MSDVVVMCIFVFVLSDVQVACVRVSVLGPLSFFVLSFYDSRELSCAFFFSFLLFFLLFCFQKLAPEEVCCCV